MFRQKFILAKKILCGILKKNVKNRDLFFRGKMWVEFTERQRVQYEWVSGGLG